MILSVAMEESPLNTDFTVCILAAGKGTRMGDYSRSLNKALLPWQGKALLSHQLEKFPEHSKFVIAVGHFAEQVENYVRIAHPGRNVTFVKVNPFEGPGSGPAVSLLACQSRIEGPFYFLSCDTLWEGPPPEAGIHSWVAVAPVKKEQGEQYSLVSVSGGRVESIFDKGEAEPEGLLAFTGLAYFADPEKFWVNLENSVNEARSEPQIPPAINSLARGSQMKAEIIEWKDLGRADLYASALSETGGFDFSKKEEAIYFVEGKVIKFFSDEEITQKRCERIRENPRVFPRILSRRGGFYSYAWEPGATLYQNFRAEVFERLFEWLPRQLWLPKEVSLEIWRSTCLSFYREKTIQRCDLLLKSCGNLEKVPRVNGAEVPPLARLLPLVPWNDLVAGARPVFFHGDLQPDNILLTANEDFLLLDWRQDFGGQTGFGDINYDLAKLSGGIDLLYSGIKENHFEFHFDPGNLRFSLPENSNQEAIREAFAKMLARNNFQSEIINLLKPIIYLNMAPLHHSPFRELLYALGRLRLHRELKSRGII